MHARDAGLSSRRPRQPRSGSTHGCGGASAANLHRGLDHRGRPLLGQCIRASAVIPFREYQGISRRLARPDRQSAFLLLLPMLRNSATVDGGIVIVRRPCFRLGRLESQSSLRLLERSLHSQLSYRRDRCPASAAPAVRLGSCRSSSQCRDHVYRPAAKLLQDHLDIILANDLHLLVGHSGGLHRRGNVLVRRPSVTA